MALEVGIDRPTSWPISMGEASLGSATELTLRSPSRNAKKFVTREDQDCSDSDIYTCYCCIVLLEISVCGENLLLQK